MPTARRNGDPNGVDLVESLQKGFRTTIDQKMDLWKKHLLDLTKRSRLVYFKPSKSSTVEITAPSVESLFLDLVEKERELSFPRPRLDRVGSNPEAPEGDEVTVIVPGYFETSSEVSELQSKLHKLRRGMKTWQEEQGIHTLYLTIGMLYWKESASSEEEFRAPLILVPVIVEREERDDPFAMTLQDEDIAVNPALSFKLDHDFGISLPSLPEEPVAGDIARLLKSVQKKASNMGWRVSEEIWLTQLSFLKVAMYEDLENAKKDAGAHSIVRAIAGAGIMPNCADIPELEDMDRKLNPTEVFPVLDADSSQMEVLVKARAGQNLIVYGPPGTGKSQTIVNLIAQFLRDHKKVLFVSEKLAALEVVFRRLKERKLDCACLEIHSHKSNKSRVIAEMGQTLFNSESHIVRGNPEGQFALLRRRQDELDDYVSELHKSRGPMSLSLFNAHGELGKYSSAPQLLFNLPCSDPIEVSVDELDGWRMAVVRLSKEAEVWNRHHTHPWNGVQLDLSKGTLDTGSLITAAVSKSLSLLSDHMELMQKDCHYFGLSMPNTLKETERILELTKPLENAVQIDPIWLKDDTQKLATRKESLHFAETLYKHLHDESLKLSRWLRKEVLDLQGLKAMLKRYEVVYRTPLRLLKKQYRSDKASLADYWKTGKPTYADSISALRSAVEVLNARKAIKENWNLFSETLSVFWSGEDTKWREAEKGLEWTTKVVEVFHAHGITPSEKILGLVSNPIHLMSSSKDIRNLITGSLDTCREQLRDLAKFFIEVRIEGGSFENAPYGVLLSWLRNKTNAAEVNGWERFQRVREETEKAGLTAFVEAALEHRLEASELEPTFMRGFYSNWIFELHSQVPILKRFKGTAHESVITEFRDIDRKLMDTTASIILASIKESQPADVTSGSRVSQLGILQREIQKKKRHRPLRQLFSETSDLVQQLKPCMLMSPLSVATYLPRENIHFDAIIFDEASQVRPEDAIGAILRGDQLIVVGDSKQLPPTNFFQTDYDSGDEYDFDDDLASLESILDECASVPGFGRGHLNWHYRSRHEELIAFSNRQFYEGKLVTFPCPEFGGMSQGVRFVYVDHGVYDRGGTRTNRTEAKAMVEAVARHLRENGGRGSLGVITLSIAQEEAVLSEWERIVKDQPDLESITKNSDPNEPMFVKALEKVQGDERDFIFISIGYGPDENGMIALNFGPVNRAGGERRLNVAVTRARERTTVFSSIHPHQLDLTKLTTGNIGVVSLKNYLEYASNGGRFSEHASNTGTAESEFEIWVKQAIESRGYSVDCQIGFSGFRVDLGIKHPDIQDRYILGIECDGATYHSLRTARERDRLRQEVLERLGWRIHRIWSTDWIRDSESCLNELVRKIEDLREMGALGVQAPVLKKADPRRQPESKAKDLDIDSVRSMLERRSQNGVIDYGMTGYETALTGQEPVTLDDDLGTLLRKIDSTARRLRNAEARKKVLSYSSGYGYNLSQQRRQQDTLYRANIKVNKIESEIRSLGKKLDSYMSRIAEIVQTEQPIHINQLCKRMAEHITVQGKGRLSVRPSTVLEYLGTRRAFTVEGEFIWLADAKKVYVNPRIPSDGTERDIDEIHIAELAGAVKWITDREFGMPSEELIRLVARTMGTKRTGGNVERRIEKAVKYAVSNQLAAKDGDLIIPLSKSGPTSGT